MEEILNHNFKGKIWNTTFSKEYCVLEIRDELTRQVNFSCINLLTGNILWENLKPDKSWWLSLVGIFLFSIASHNVVIEKLIKQVLNWLQQFCNKILVLNNHYVYFRDL